MTGQDAGMREESPDVGYELSAISKLLDVPSDIVRRCDVEDNLRPELSQHLPTELAVTYEILQHLPKLQPFEEDGVLMDLIILLV